MDGRFMGYGHEGASLARRDQSFSASEGADEDGAIDESEMAHTPGSSDSDPDTEESGVDGEMVLSRDDFDLLQAFHRLVPLPALRSKILRVVCDDDLQVTEEEIKSIGEVGNPPAAFGVKNTHERSLCPKRASPANVALSLETTIKHSPLTRRLSTKTSTKSLMGSSMTKPHREVDLAAQTPRLKKLVTPGVTRDPRNDDDRAG